MPKPPVIVAIVAAYNEADIIGEAVRALIDGGVQVYFLDDGSTDATLAEVRRFEGRGVIGVETLPPVNAGGAGGAGSHVFNWHRILSRKEELSRELNADWFIHHDADEFRESPWEGVTLAEAIGRVDAAGFNAIDFHVLDFKPTGADNATASSVKDRLQFYEPAGPYDRLQVKCWKKTAAPVCLTATAGHEAEFADRRVFPIRFLLRHYPIRSQAHGERKVLGERLPLYDPAERALGWHVQYDRYSQDATFLWDPAALSKYDPIAVRLQVMLEHRDVESLRQEASLRSGEVDQLRRLVQERDLQIVALNEQVETLHAAQARSLREIDELQQELIARHAELSERRAQIDALDASLKALRMEREEQDRRLDSLIAARARLTAESARLLGEVQRLERLVQSHETELDRLRSRTEQLSSDLAAVRRRAQTAEEGMAKLLASRSWRLTRPLRAADQLLRRHAPAGRPDGHTAKRESLPVTGGLWLASDVAVFWDDRWAGRTLEFEVGVGQTIAGVSVSGFVPAELTGGQELRLRIGEREWTCRLAAGPFDWSIAVDLQAHTNHKVLVSAASSWQPSSTGAPDDARELAWQVRGISGRAEVTTP
jgi:glycosyltransferase involved in cell wall biosynthesis